VLFYSKLSSLLDVATTSIRGEVLFFRTKRTNILSERSIAVDDRSEHRSSLQAQRRRLHRRNLSPIATKEGSSGQRYGNSERQQSNKRMRRRGYGYVSIEGVPLLALDCFKERRTENREKSEYWICGASLSATSSELSSSDS
jgi:hypothetical protein